MTETSDRAKWAAVVPAAGMGLRMKGGQPKQFMTVGRRPIIIHTLSVLAACPKVTAIVVAVPADSVDDVAGLIKDYGVGKVEAVIAGGETRQESVALGVAAAPSECNYILIHDGVRPLIDQPTIERVMAAARASGAATAGIPAHDTLAEVDRKRRLVSQPSRAKMWQVQTPQAFWRPFLVEAQARAAADNHVGTDEAGLLLRMGRPVQMVDGSPLNIKLTTPSDLKLAQALFAWRESGL